MICLDRDGPRSPGVTLARLPGPGNEPKNRKSSPNKRSGWLRPTRCALGPYKEVGMNTPPDTAPEQPEQEQPPAPAPAPAPAILPAPILPAQSSEDTDVGWGDYAE